MSSLWVRLGWGGGEQVMNSPYTLRVGNYVAPTHQPYLIGNPAGGTTNYAEPQDWGVLTYQRVAWQLLAGEQRLVTFQNVFRDGYPGCEEDQCERRAGASAAPGGCTALRSHSNSKHAEPTRLGGAIGDRRPDGGGAPHQRDDGGGAPHQRDAAIPCLIHLPSSLWCRADDSTPAQIEDVNVGVSWNTYPPHTQHNNPPIIQNPR